MEYIMYIVRPFLVFLLVYFAVKESLKNKFIIEVKGEKKQFVHPNAIITRVLKGVVLLHFIINIIIIQIFNS